VDNIAGVFETDFNTTLLGNWHSGLIVCELNRGVSGHNVRTQERVLIEER
jgi:hypothetical protein